MLLAVRNTLRTRFPEDQCTVCRDGRGLGPWMPAERFFGNHRSRVVVVVVPINDVLWNDCWTMKAMRTLGWKGGIHSANCYPSTRVQDRDAAGQNLIMGSSAGPRHQRGALGTRELPARLPVRCILEGCENRC